jgi:phosphoglycolate phosphatase-like HAD superfamily hydrolase
VENNLLNTMLVGLIVYLDFDGTVITNMKRFYIVYLLALEAVRKKAYAKGEIVELYTLSEMEFAHVMRQGKRDLIAGMSGVTETYLTTYYTEVNERANCQELSNLDEPYPGAMSAIHRLISTGAEIVIVSCRPTIEIKKVLNNSFLELRIYGGDHPELKQLSLDDKCEVKSKLLARARSDRDPLNQRESYMVGDHEMDILAAKSEGIPVIALSNGMRSPKFLLSYEPDLLLTSLAEAVDLLLEEVKKSA